jgi:hypothetical protein
MATEINTETRTSRYGARIRFATSFRKHSSRCHVVVL